MLIMAQRDIFLHGTTKDVLNKVKKDKLYTKAGRATFTQSLKYTTYYAGETDTEILKNGVLLVFKSKYLKIAKDSWIKVKNSSKTVIGWPNRWRTEQYGFFPKSKNQHLGEEQLVASFYYTSEFLAFIDEMFDRIIAADISQTWIDAQIARLAKLLSKKEIQAITPKISLKILAETMVRGTVRNLILREIRANYISCLVLNGYKIHNPGQHSCDRWLKKDVKKSIGSVAKLIDKKFIPSDVRAEFTRLLA